ncbi:MAG TPA: lytic murein transglycosylase [Rhodopila sp.]|uniref:lytic murein transglycosylase n=1 Tax=Rhodopila sp. TaxID=2480087 RepID=UPI002CF93EE1|nr:lytic murein transglycosylase [Rhodopila sp.]HVY18246.1 lytic murein transglycosylase [Rhodopila sp.]
MPTRRFLISALPSTLLATRAFAEPVGSFQDFLRSVGAEARRAGISQATLDRAFAGIRPNEKVLERDRHQPEFTLTWAKYRSIVITSKRITDGRAAFAAHRLLFQRVQQRYGVSAGAIVGIWGIESSFGTGTGSFNVIESLATLAWDGRRASFFRGELLAALKILNHGDVSPAAMTGSYAGAMGQPQFMPTSYLRYAVDFEGHGRRDIWTSTPDVLASIANYLAESGWRAGQGWGQAVVPPRGMTAPGRDATRPLGEWARAGVRPVIGRWVATADMPAGLIAPDGPTGEAFLVFPNFNAIRRYNPSDYYALAVGLIGDQVVA